MLTSPPVHVVTYMIICRQRIRLRKINSCVQVTRKENRVGRQAFSLCSKLFFIEKYPGTSLNFNFEFENLSNVLKTSGSGPKCWVDWKPFF